MIRLTLPATVQTPLAAMPAAAPAPRPVVAAVQQAEVSTQSPAPQPTPTPTQTIQEQIQPVSQWADILEAYRSVNPAVSGSLAESDAYIRGGTLLIVAKNPFFLTLLKNHENARSLGDTVRQILGQEYKILAKCSNPAQTEVSPVQTLLQKPKTAILKLLWNKKIFDLNSFFKEISIMKARLPKQNMGGAQNMNAMIRQAQKMQDEITTLQEDIENREFSATSGGGAVSVVVTGKKTIKSLTINKEVVDPEDVEMLQDLVISAINEAVNQVESTTETEMSKITGGVSLPGLF